MSKQELSEHAGRHLPLQQSTTESEWKAPLPLGRMTAPSARNSEAGPAASRFRDAVLKNNPMSDRLHGDNRSSLSEASAAFFLTASAGDSVGGGEAPGEQLGVQPLAQGHFHVSGESGDRTGYLVVYETTAELQPTR
ncbi:hypothetical protein EYF80_031928 [Liparis tanakae]|uniref:Uncharacterized protein n=1 Tax=Liparis tanakae TaxID=230148 RepID=A0A4Z2GWF0_9TELE|nr:hypothetical protein EYF80_031928 [Liparis tanakae]